MPGEHKRQGEINEARFRAHVKLGLNKIIFGIDFAKEDSMSALLVTVQNQIIEIFRIPPFAATP